MSTGFKTWNFELYCCPLVQHEFWHVEFWKLFQFQWGRIFVANFDDAIVSLLPSSGRSVSSIYFCHQWWWWWMLETKYRFSLCAWEADSYISWCVISVLCRLTYLCMSRFWKSGFGLLFHMVFEECFRFLIRFISLITHVLSKSFRLTCPIEAVRSFFFFKFFDSFLVLFIFVLVFWLVFLFPRLSISPSFEVLECPLSTRWKASEIT